jgi:hypothetical protein
LVFKVFFILKHIKIIFFIFKKLFLISTHQNNPKKYKNINLKQKIKKNYFFLKTLPKHNTKGAKGS